MTDMNHSRFNDINMELINSQCMCDTIIKLLGGRAGTET